MPRQVLGTHVGSIQVQRGVQHIGVRDFLPRQNRFGFHFVVREHLRQLLYQVRPELRRTRNGGGVGAGPVQCGESARNLRNTPGGPVVQAQLRVGERAIVPHGSRGRGGGFEVGAEGAAQPLHGLQVERLEFIDQRVGAGFGGSLGLHLTRIDPTPSRMRLNP